MGLRTRIKAAFFDLAVCYLLFAAIGSAAAAVSPADSQNPKALRALADKGDAAAQYYLGLNYRFGEGVPMDYGLSLSWLKKSAEQGHREAQYYLALSYHDGVGTKRDDAESVVWLRKSADQGYSEAQSMLGTFYTHGEGVPQNYP